MPIPNFTTYFNSYEGISEVLKTYSGTDVIAQVADMVNVDSHTLSTYPINISSKTKEKCNYTDILFDLMKNISYYIKRLLYKLFAYSS